LLADVNFRRKNFESGTPVVEKVTLLPMTMLASSQTVFADDLLAFGQGFAGELAGDAHGERQGQIEDDRPSMSPLMAMRAATPFAAIGVLVIERSAIFVGACKASAKTASAALIKAG